jgi:hypothetical protein
MKNIHVCTKAAWLKHALNFRNCHYLDLPNDLVAVIGEMDPSLLQDFERDDSVTPLPFILSGEKLPPAAVTALAHLGVSETDTTMTATLKIQRAHPAFHATQF